MLDESTLNEIVRTYENHGWLLRRVVLVDPTTTADGLDAAIPRVAGIIDAAWFSRPPADHPIAWEVRYLGPTQYALVGHFEELSPDFEENLRDLEQRLADAVGAKRFA